MARTMGRPKGYRLNAYAFDAFRDLALGGMSLSQLAKESNIPLSTLAGMRKNDHGATLPRAVALAETMGVPPEALFPELDDFRDTKVTEKAA